ncbi:alpha/beta fold hydrolase [Treponema primitia]|uniref:alpha/beta hydrolase n=1 Tax=Treponema primitia TaxID=88058 RepID=UPI00397F366D
MYVEVYIPSVSSEPYPLILFHGGGQTGVNWMGTPDGRMGWLDVFLRMGYTVFVVDVPARGRSAYHPDMDGPLIRMSADLTHCYFADHKGDWPAAGLHTQWPGAEERDERGYDKNYDELCSAQVEYVTPAYQQKLVQDAGAALLKRTGPAVLITHSMAGPYGWAIADLYPEHVKAIAALEPSGPPFGGISISSGKQRPYGIADIPLAYHPELRMPEWRREDKFCPPDVNDTTAWLQPEPAGKLVNLEGIPVILITGEASYHSPFDHLTAAFLKQAGVSVDFVPLAEKGIHGNGHMMMLEKNSDVIAELIHHWLQEHLY